MKQRRAFTLVELLVVIAIIAILIGILLPSLIKAKRSALYLQCSANLKNLGVTYFNYAADNQGNLPQFFADPVNVNEKAPNFTGANGGLWMWDLEVGCRDALVKYGASMNTLYCPTNLDQDQVGLWNYGVNQTAPGGPTGYGVMGYVMLTKRPDGAYPTPLLGNVNAWWNYQAKLRPQNTSYDNEANQYTRPDISSTTEIAMDAILSNGTSPNLYFGGTAGGYTTDGFRHQSAHFFGGKVQNANILFLDGHVEARVFSFIQTHGQYIPNSNGPIFNRCDINGNDPHFWW
jgi:prepilin-type N-terminal cleavage/methylation domain-containing protein/prepilin-type processing-associated H-X9-DG protein